MILERILANTRADLVDRKRRRGGEPFPPRFDTKRDFAAALRGTEGVRIIAEVKRRSPSRGLLREDYDPAGLALQLTRGGAAAISVLTDAKFFGGALEHLRQVRIAVDRPVLRKDFIVDPWQIEESAATGADAVLLIVAAAGSDLKALMNHAAGCDLEVLVEVHDERELEQALAAYAPIIGINNRDLRSFATDFSTTLRLRPLVPDDHVVVSESGIRDRADVRRLEQAGVHAILVGEAFMTVPNPAVAVRELLGD
jgi:indole-3-glycerol phosphate synthase